MVLHATGGPVRDAWEPARSEMHATLRPGSHAWTGGLISIDAPESVQPITGRAARHTAAARSAAGALVPSGTQVGTASELFRDFSIARRLGDGSSVTSRFHCAQQPLEARAERNSTLADQLRHPGRVSAEA